MECKLDQSMMSPEQILGQKLMEPALLSRGQKKNFPDETSDKIVDRLQNDLHNILCYERVDRRIARSQAEYNAMTGLVVVTRKVGKWKGLGYRRNELDCLQYYEALYLIDINRLELYYDSVLVSLEQAHSLLLNDSKSFEKYIIYSNLSKAGYIVQPHRANIEIAEKQFKYTKELSPADKCVWHYLFKELKLTSNFDNIRETDELYVNVKRNMIALGDAIKNQCTVSVVDDEKSESWQNVSVSVSGKSCLRKRKIDSPIVPSTSKKNLQTECTTNRFVDTLTFEEDFRNFKTIFNHIQVIELEQCHENDEDCAILEFDFDLYLAQATFKQSDPAPPNYRILIFKSSDQPPTREVIVKSFLKPATRVPVLVFYVNEFMRISAFLYRISL